MSFTQSGQRVVIHVIDSLGIGGAERLLQTTLLSLPQYRHVVCYLTPPHDLAKDLMAYAVYHLGFTGNKDFLKCALRLRKIISEVKPVLVHAHLLRSTWVSRLATWRKVPLFFSIHNFLSEDAFKVNALSLKMEKATYSSKQTLISVSEAALKDYDQWVGLKGAHYVLYNIISDVFFTVGSQRGLQQHAEITRLVAVGNLRRQKNYENLVRAFTFLKDEKVSLDIYGKGDLAAGLQQLITEHQVPVRLMGPVADISNVLMQYDTFVLASLFEGYGIAPVEAMASGLPVLLSDLEVFREISGGHAQFFNPNDPISIATAIRTFISLPLIQKQSYSQAGQEQAVRLASKEAFKAKLNMIYESINLE